MCHDRFAAETVPVELGFIGVAGDGDDEAAFFHHAVGARHRIGACPFQDDVDILDHIFEFRFRVIDRLIDAELFEQILVRRRGGGDDSGAARFRDLNSKMSHAA